MFALETQVATDYPETQFPLIHGNGNSGKQLGSQYFHALRALNAFQEDFYRIEFHQRDYYPMGDEAWLKARAQWESQKASIASLRHFLESHAAHCFESIR